METFKKIYTKAKQIFDFVFYNGLIVFMVIAVVSFGSSVMKGQEPTVFGYKPIYILTGSMTSNDPDTNIRERSVIISQYVDEADRKDLDVGDVVTYRNYDMNQNREVNITHRIIEIDHENGTFVAKGDANLKEDWFDTPEGPTRDIPIDNITFKLQYRWNWVANLVAMATNKPSQIALYAVSIISLIVLLKIIDSSLYKDEYEIKLIQSKAKKQEQLDELEKERMRKEIEEELKTELGIQKSTEATKEEAIKAAVIEEVPEVIEVKEKEKPTYDDITKELERQKEQEEKNKSLSLEDVFADSDDGVPKI